MRGGQVKRLDTEQRAAAAIGQGPVRVVAGAGTGKTAVIAERFGRLVLGGASPDSILVMTFTDRAAAEMRERIEGVIGTAAPAVGTFHAIALSWLRADGRAIGVPVGFRIITGADRWILARELMWELGDLALTGDERPDDLVAPALQMLERLKQELVPLDRLERWAKTAEEREKAELMQACVRLFRSYERACRKAKLLDFEDLLALSVRMLEQRPALLEAYRARYPHVLVDEYQDLNLAQERLVELVAGGGEPFVVGDDDQSIYRFRGASRASLARFLAAFPTAQTVTRGRNHRSSRRIVGAASALIGNNPDRLPKQLRSGLAGDKVEIWACPDGETEAAGIASGALQLIRSGTAPPASLDQESALAVLRDRNELAPIEALARWSPVSVFARLLIELTRLAAVLDVRDLFFELMNRTRYLEALSPALESSEAARAAANLSRFAELIAESCELSDDRSLEAYMRHLDLVLLSQEDEKPAEVEGLGDAIQVMTIHQAKGLEFDAVFVPGLVEGRLPQSGRSPRFELPAAVLEPLVRGREDVIAEERRLLYVAMTRAKRFLNLTRASHYEGGRRWRDSRFLEEVRAAGARTALLQDVVGKPTPPPLPLPRQSRGAPKGGEGVPALVLSFSSIAAYRDCPRQYWYRYVQRLPAVQSAEAVQGVIMHETLRRAGEARRDGADVTAAMLRSIHREVWNATAFPDPRRAATFERNGVAQLESYRRSGGLDGLPAHLEQTFNVTVDGWMLNGVVDRIDRTPDAWRIIDYKTGRHVSRGRRDLQVALYALGASSALKLDPVELEIVYLASGESVRVEHTGALLTEAEKQGTEVAEGVRSGHFEARPDRRRCRLCPYRLVCAEAL